MIISELCSKGLLRRIPLAARIARSKPVRIDGASMGAVVYLGGAGPDVVNKPVFFKQDQARVVRRLRRVHRLGADGPSPPSPCLARPGRIASGGCGWRRRRDDG